MALVSLKETLGDAKKRNYAVPMFDVTNVEMMRQVIRTAEDHAFSIGADVGIAESGRTGNEAAVLHPCDCGPAVITSRHIGGTVADHAVFSDIQSFFNSHIFTSVILMGSASVAALFRSVLPDNIHPSE